MRWDEIIRDVRNGFPVRRKCWSKGDFIYLNNNKVLCRVPADGLHLSCNLSFWDLDADDWEAHNTPSRYCISIGLALLPAIDAIDENKAVAYMIKNSLQGGPPIPVDVPIAFVIWEDGNPDTKEVGIFTKTEDGPIYITWFNSTKNTELVI